MLWAAIAFIQAVRLDPSPVLAHGAAMTRFIRIRWIIIG
jgi:hypothetical protein